MKKGICKRGHIITDETAYHSNGKRQCGICKRAYATRRTRPSSAHCKRGHLLSPDNTKIMSGGGRRCLACREFVQAARLASRGVHEIPDEPVVERVAFRVVVDPVTAAIFGGRK